MATSSIPVDLFNPGQVFACLGFMELSEVLLGSVRARFDWTDPNQSRFELIVGAGDPFSAVLDFLSEAEVRLLLPPGSELTGKKWGVEDEFAGLNDGFPQPTPLTPASLPAVLRSGRHRVVVDSWGDATGRDNVKFWAGSGGYPGAALVRDALALLADRLKNARQDPFDVSAPQSSSLRFDWRRDYVPLGAGFSLNEHGKKLVPLGRPLVEVLAVIGLSHARPLRPDRRNKLRYRYGVLGGAPVNAMFHRAALGCASLPFVMRRFSITLDWPGQENQARCITSVTEDYQT
jgi:CRISPR-associated protein Csb3